MQILVSLDLSDAEVKQLRQNSIERVLNNAIRCGEYLESIPEMAEDGSTLWQDCDELKPMVCRIWQTLQNETYKEKERERPD